MTVVNSKSSMASGRPYDKCYRKGSEEMDERAHATRLEGNTNENFATSAIEIVPLILSGHVVKVWSELDTAEEDVVAHVVVGTALWLLLAQVRLQRYLRIAGYITVGVSW